MEQKTWNRNFPIPIAAAVLFLALFLLFQLSVNFLKSDNSSTKFFEVKSGEGLFLVADNLAKENLIKNKYLFVLYALAKKGSNKIQRGQYSFDSGISIREIADKLIRGDVAKITITIPEGYNIKDIEDILKSKFFAQGESASGGKIQNLMIKSFQKEYSFLEDVPENNDLEGFLFPDTYDFALEANSEEIARTMLDNFDKKLTLDLRAEIKKQNKTIYEIITMASLIEKEVRTEEDMKLVSGILRKRLSIGMPLQVDATIVYLTCTELAECTGKKTTEVTLEDLKIDSPYNTYLYRGLPPGPISNPGLLAIKAAIYPKTSDYLYYLSKPDGETVFSKTFTEHNAAKQKFLK